MTIVTHIDFDSDRFKQKREEARSRYHGQGPAKFEAGYTAHVNKYNAALFKFNVAKNKLIDVAEGMFVFCRDDHFRSIHHA